MRAASFKLFGRDIRFVTPVAIVLAPILGAVVAAVALGCIRIALDGPSALPPQQFGDVFVVGIFFGAVFGVAPALVFGLPIHAVMLGRRMTSVWHYAGMGLCVAILGMLVVLILYTGFYAMMVGLAALTFAIGGASGGAFFWLLRRPDRDTAAAASQ